MSGPACTCETEGYCNACSPPPWDDDFDLDATANELLLAAARSTLIECRKQWQQAMAALRAAEVEVEAAYKRVGVPLALIFNANDGPM